jgi:hypothetical protein
VHSPWVSVRVVPNREIVESYAMNTNRVRSQAELRRSTDSFVRSISIVRTAHKGPTDKMGSMKNPTSNRDPEKQLEFSRIYRNHLSNSILLMLMDEVMLYFRTSSWEHKRLAFMAHRVIAFLKEGSLQNFGSLTYAITTDINPRYRAHYRHSSVKTLFRHCSDMVHNGNSYM